MEARQDARRWWSTKRYPSIVVVLTAWLVGAPLDAQLGTQYKSPGQPTDLRSRPSKDEFQLKLEKAPWKLGRFRVSPWLGLQDVSLVESLGNRGQTTGEDFTVTAGAGLRGYVPAGRKVIWAAHALPEYVWWEDNEAKRDLNGRYGLGLFVFFNRMTLELSQRRIDGQGFFSSEIQALNSSRQDVSTFNVDVELSPYVSLFAVASRQAYRNKETETEIFSALDREVESGMIGLRYENPRGWEIELSHVDRSSDFDLRARALSNSGTATTATIGLQRPATGFRLRVTANDREAAEDSDFGSFTETTGAFDTLWKPSPRFAVLGYARRELSYAVVTDYAQIVTERQGVSFNFSLGEAVVGLYSETGEDDFKAVSLLAPRRLDDVTAYGAVLLVELKGLSLSVRASQTEYDSNLDGFDREVTSLNFGIKLDAITRLTSELIDRLSLGRSDSEW